MFSSKFALSTFEVPRFGLGSAHLQASSPINVGVDKEKGNATWCNLLSSTLVLLATACLATVCQCVLPFSELAMAWQ